MQPAGFETAIPAGVRPQTHDLHRAGNGGRNLPNLIQRKFHMIKALMGE